MRALIIATALAAGIASPALACGVTRMNPAELRAAQTRDLREADLVFVARVTGQAASDDPNYEVVLYEPIQKVSGSGHMPESLAVSVFYCLPLPPVGETQVILMRSADVSDIPGRTSPVLGYYAVSDIHHDSLRQRVEWALQRANTQ